MVSFCIQQIATCLLKYSLMATDDMRHCDSVSSRASSSRRRAPLILSVLLMLPPFVFGLLVFPLLGSEGQLHYLLLLCIVRDLNIMQFSLQLVTASRQM